MVRVDLLCLGTGKASTHIYHGEPSTGFVVLQDGEPAVLLGAGLGIVRSCMHYCSRVPDVIYVSHNHSDHAGELPLLLSVEAGKGRRKRVVAEADVMRRVIDHRLAEYHESIELSNRRLGDLADFIDAHEGQACPLTDLLSIVPHRAQHSERCFGFVLYCGQQQVLGWGADSGYDPRYYAKLSVAPVIVLDARQGGSYDHAAFDDVAEHERQLNGGAGEAVAVYVACYGTQQEAPTAPQPLRIGQTLVLHEDSLPPRAVAPPSLAQPPSAALQRPAGAAGRRPHAGHSPTADPAPPAAPPPDGTAQDYAPQPRAPPQPQPPGAWQQPTPASVDLAPAARQSSGSTARRSRSAQRPGAQRSSSVGAAGTRNPSLPPQQQDRSAAIRGLQQHLQMVQDGGESSVARVPSQARTGRGTSPHPSRQDEMGLRREYSFPLPGQTDVTRHAIEKFPSPSPGPRKVHVHNNECKGAPPRVFLVKEVRTLEQFKLRVAQQLAIKPIKGIYTVDGYLVRHLDELQHGMELVAVKHAGAPFDAQDLPAHVAPHLNPPIDAYPPPQGQQGYADPGGLGYGGDGRLL